MSAETIDNYVSTPLFEVDSETQPYSLVHGVVYVNGEPVSYTASVPANEIMTDATTAFPPGLAESSERVLAGVRNETAARYGTVAVSYGRPEGSRFSSIYPDLFAPTKLRVDTLAAVLDDLGQNKNFGEVANGDKVPLSRVNLAPHSYGNHAAIRYALRHPDNLVNIVQMMPVGMANDGILRQLGSLAGCFGELASYCKDHGPDLSIRDLGSEIRRAAEQPVLFFGEAGAAHKANNLRHLPTLQMEHAIGIAILTGEYDNVIPASSVKESAEKLVGYYEMLPTDHFGPQKEPELVASAVMRALDHLNSKRATALMTVPSQRSMLN